MKTFDKLSLRSFGSFVLALICLLSFTAGTSYGADYYLKARTRTIPINAFNNPTAIYMWAYALCTDATFTNCSAPQVPGPTLTATEGDTLNIHVRNNLPITSTAGAFREPVSVIIPGLAGGNLTPTWTDGTTGNRTDLSQRVRSFTSETPADNSTVVTYTWPSVNAGTYLYQSGTHPAVQVQMGLYGALVVYPAAGGQAYSDPSSAFDSESILLFSEIDPTLHNAVATGAYGVTMTSTIDYHPKYFLINGKANPSGDRAGVPRVPAGAPGQRLLIRFLNACLEPKVPVVQGPYMSIIAEDGTFMTAVNAAGVEIPAPKQQYSVLLPPGKTMDAIMTTPAAAGLMPVYDRRLNLTNSATSPGGMLVFLRTQ
jgi:FtsP/CotA-like multicopper oxidase with cupredoxin domain